ncbi:MAG: alpha-amylase family glycosyl hydrolase, partial [Clostridia bacterium]
REERACSRLSGAELALAKNRLFAAAFLLFTLPGCPCIYYGDEIGMQGFEDPFNRGYMGDRTGDEELLACYGALVALRNESAALQKGRLEPAFCDEGVYAFYRIWQAEQILCVVNVSAAPKALYLSNSRTVYEKNTWTKENELLLLPYGSAAVRLKGDLS